jgi:ABC-2 type transport system permease protein
MRTALYEVAALAGRRLMHLRSAPGRLVGMTFNSLITILAVGYLFAGSIKVPGGGSYQEYLMAGAAAQIGLAGIAPTAIGVSVDLQRGLTDRFRSLPITRGSVLIGHSIGDLVVGLVALAIVSVVAALAGWRVHTGFLPVVGGFVLVAMFIYVMIWIGVLLGMTLRNVESIDSLGGIVVIVFSFLSNAFLSTETLPPWIRPFAEWNPVSSVTNACRRLWGNPIVTDSGFPGRNPVVVVVVSFVLLLIVGTVLSFRRYRVAAAA